MHGHLNIKKDMSILMFALQYIFVNIPWLILIFNKQIPLVD